MAADYAEADRSSVCRPIVGRCDPPGLRPNGGLRPLSPWTTVECMNHRILHLVSTVVTALFAAGVVFGAPAQADPVSNTSTVVEMPMPGPGKSDSAYKPPSVGVTVQDGAGGVDRDGTNGMIDPDGTDGMITGPLMRATPGIRAEPAPISPHIRS